ncbi:MAG: DUF2586 family protein [Bacteroidales bacterium]|nr:DUF2586 family protein [Bacteroidales bacterium]
MLPRVIINFANASLGRVTPSPDGVFGLLATGVSVVNTFNLLTSYLVRSMDDVTKGLGITTENNPGLYKVLSEFYAEAGDGTELWLRAFADTVTMTQMVDSSIEANAKALLQDAGGRIRALFVHRTPPVGYTEEVTSGYDADVTTAITKAQTLGEYATNSLKAPIFVVISGLYFQGSTTVDLREMTNNRVAVMIGDTVPGDGCAIGVLAGRLAKDPVHRNCGRVRSGALKPTVAYVGSTKVDTADITSLHDKGYITFRKHVGRAGYFFTDDPLATLPTDDYNGIAVRRVIDKAYRLAYGVMLDETLEEITVNDAGQVSISYAKSVENRVENAIVNSMTANGELGNDPDDQNDTAVECLVDTDQNVVSTGKLVVGLRIKPVGYAKYIEVELGFKTITQ